MALNIQEVALYLQKNYYPKYAHVKPGCVPDNKTLTFALDLHKDKLIVIKMGKEILGVGLFITLTDETIECIESIDVGDVKVLAGLLQEKGQHIHFILLATSGIRNILEGIKQVKKLKPKSISWWNPTQTRLHRFKLGD